MRKNCFLLTLTLLAALLPATLFAQDDHFQVEPEDTILEVDIRDEAAPILANLDSMTNLLFKNSFQYLDTTQFNAFNFDSADVPVYPDSVVEERLSLIPTDIPLELNPYVRRYIEVYSVERREQVSNMLTLSQIYFPIFEAELERRGMPHELKYLPVVESALNPNAVSRAGAVGLWQIIYTTGRMLNLNINSYIDERRDPWKSTDAGLDYLSNMYEVYDDWLLVIASYNCGPGNVNKAMRRSGGNDFWSIRNYLPRETRGYVPAFIAATYVMTYHEEYNLQPLQYNYSFFGIDTVHIYKRVALQDIADATGIDYGELCFLNPSLKKKVIPATREGYVLRLPMTHLIAFEGKREELLNPDPEEEAVAANSSSGSKTVTTTSISKKTTTSVTQQGYHSGEAKLTYTVKSGDNLGYIAEWYDCRAQDLRNWNNIFGNTIRVGQKLDVWVPEGQVNRYKNVDQMSFSAKQEIEQKGSAATTTASAGQQGDCSNCTIYVVKPGDTLWEIAQLYPGISADDIKRLNGIGNSKGLKPGMKLKIGS